MTDIAIIIVGLNASNYVKACVESLGQSDCGARTHEIIYVDNGSVDDTLAMLADNFPSVRVHANESNLGFCKAANLGAKLANTDTYFFLNDDTVVRKDSISLLADALESDPDMGVIASRLLFPDLTEQYSGRRFPSIANGVLVRRSFLTRIFPNSKPVSDYLYKDRLASADPFPVDWVSAAALMIRKETFEAVGGFAEDYYYWHEAVFCERVRRKGKEIYLHPRSIIIHHEGKGSGSRPFAVRRWHILDFHRAAYRCYCERYALGRFSVRRWFAAVALTLRAASLLAGNWISTQSANLQDSRSI
jgi:N-acetylglucosaminyl-diphospho-decaprenol L-rhamnosyltransferase